MILFKVVPIFHAILSDILPNFGAGGFFGFDFLVTILSLGLFVLGVAAIYWWVSNGGPGVFAK